MMKITRIYRARQHVQKRTGAPFSNYGKLVCEVQYDVERQLMADLVNRLQMMTRLSASRVPYSVTATKGNRNNRTEIWVSSDRQSYIRHQVEEIARWLESRFLSAGTKVQQEIGVNEC